MADEKSCGAIVFTYENGIRKYVIIRETGIYQGYCGFPKGHMEAGETEQDTAIREVKEETGLDIELLDGFRQVDEHFLAREGRPNDKKTNVYFLAEYHDQELKARESEVSEIVLMGYRDALESLQYNESKRELAEAESFINSRLGGSMKKTLIFYKPEYADLAIKLRDNYRAHGHGEADIVSVEEHDDIEYAEKMQYDEAVFIEDNDAVAFHDIESGYINRLPVSDVFYNDPKPDSHEAVTSRDMLNILADAISDAGSWWCWHVGDDMLQLEFRDVQLYDEAKAEKETHTTDVLAVRFYGHVFAVFLDDLNEKNWHVRFRDDDSVLYPVDTYDMAFDDNKEAESLLNDYRNRIPIKDFKGAETLVTAKHILCARCDVVGFIVGGDEIKIVGKKGEYTEEEIEPLSKKWWEYWKEYWRLRGTRDALPKDFACEVTIPVDKEAPQGNW